jgi:DNA primase
VAFLYRYFDKLPKYKNTKNNQLFTKNEYLYNIDKIQKLLKKNKRLWIMEGAFCAASCYQMGEAGLAYCGITFSKEHVEIIKNVTKHIEGVQIILVPDADGRAEKWVFRGRELFNKHYPTASIKVATIGE